MVLNAVMLKMALCPVKIVDRSSVKSAVPS